jgi:YebC/PmpR family DNA-binding regulatory protein
MAGHSKWANIKHRKGAQDAKRSKQIARLVKAIEAAAKTGGADPDANPALATAIQKAKDNDVPKDNIERALKRAAGAEGGGVDYEYATFEGYAPAGVALYIECLTDNRNRASNEVRGAFKKMGGNMAEPGAVGYLFSRHGEIRVPAEGIEEDDILLAALEAGIDEVTLEDDTYLVTTDPKNLQDVRVALEEAEIPVRSSEVTLRPSVNVPVHDEAEAKRVLKLIDTLEDLDDVQNVYANFDIPDNILEAVA